MESLLSITPITPFSRHLYSLYKEIRNYEKEQQQQDSRLVTNESLNNTHEQSLDQNTLMTPKVSQEYPFVSATQLIVDEILIPNIKDKEQPKETILEQQSHDTFPVSSSILTYPLTSLPSDIEPTNNIPSAYHENSLPLAPSSYYTQLKSQLSIPQHTKNNSLTNNTIGGNKRVHDDKDDQFNNHADINVIHNHPLIIDIENPIIMSNTYEEIIEQIHKYQIQEEKENNHLSLSNHIFDDNKDNNNVIDNVE